MKFTGLKFGKVGIEILTFDVIEILFVREEILSDEIGKIPVIYLENGVRIISIVTTEEMLNPELHKSKIDTLKSYINAEDNASR